VIRTGVVLPLFRESPAGALEVALEVLGAGVDGVFCYDHLWPLGEPDRPALAPFPLLAALAAMLGTSEPGEDGPYFGTLVARVGLVPNAVLLEQFSALAHLAPGRVIAGLGTGDRLSEAENLAYGVPFAPAAARRADMVALGKQLRARDITVWVAGGAAARTEETLAVGAALTVWDAEPALVTRRSQGPDAVEVTWAGPPPGEAEILRATVRMVAAAGATWAIFGWPVDPAALVAAARDAEAELVEES
jgi:alkanesulfonate monooxygenase SsuD/methylene tetrahydromethanopterin reductase-like flavin-dependent oxidoreductase (luciferase family)